VISASWSWAFWVASRHEPMRTLFRAARSFASCSAASAAFCLAAASRPASTTALPASKPVFAWPTAFSALALVWAPGPFLESSSTLTPGIGYSARSRSSWAICRVNMPVAIAAETSLPPGTSASAWAKIAPSTASVIDGGSSSLPNSVKLRIDWSWTWPLRLMTSRTRS
jgi:hypothetical protein